MQQFVPFYAIIRVISSCDSPYFTLWNDVNYFTFHYQRHHHPQL